MAIRLEKAGWSKAQTQLGAQIAYDRWQARPRAEETMKVIADSLLNSKRSSAALL